VITAYARIALDRLSTAEDGTIVHQDTDECEKTTIHAAAGTWDEAKAACLKHLPEGAAVLFWAQWPV
jgi:hypothetical protein